MYFVFWGKITTFYVNNKGIVTISPQTQCILMFMSIDLYIIRYQQYIESFVMPFCNKM